MEKSKNYNFNLPNSGNDEIADINDISDNFRIIDKIMNETDQTFEPTSTKAASGKAVNEAISGIQPIDENTEFVFDGGDADGGVSVDIVVDTVLSKTSNNPIANKPVAIKFGEILGAIDTLKNMVHIVESGTSGIWSYRKWSDGTAECWGTYNFQLNLVDQFQNVWAGHSFTLNLPSGLFVSTTSLSDTCVQMTTDNLWSAACMAINNNEIGVKCFSGYKYENYGVTLFISIIGRWK